MFSKNTPAVLATLILGITLSGSALACSTDGWDDAVNVVVGSPFGTVPDGIWRFEEECAMRATGMGHVQTNSPTHAEVTNRFYFYSDLEGNGDVEILVGYNAVDGTGELFHIGFDGSNVTFDTTGQGGGDTFSVAVPEDWNWVEYKWDSNADTFDFWVNADPLDPPTGSIDGGAGAATLESVRLGLPNGLDTFTGGGINFDSFEMHNTTPVGPLLNCDANGDTAIDVLDLIEAIDEINEVILAQGLPDCDFSGGPIDVLDLVAMISAINAQ